VLCSLFQDKVEPVHKVTIIPRGFTGGATHYLLTDKSNYSRNYLEQHLAGLMGGRAAEEIVFGELTTGAGIDIQRATDLAKKMVCNWGMSERIGPMTVGREQGEVFLGKELTQRDFYSEDTARIVDAEIRSLIERAHKRSKEILAAHREVLDAMSERLLETETLGAEEIFAIVLEHVTEDDRELVEKKHAQAMEMRLESREEPEETPEEEASAEADDPTEEPPTEDTPAEEPPADDTPEPENAPEEPEERS